MGLQKIVVLCLAGVVVVGGGVYFLSTQNSGEQAVEQSTTQTDTSEQVSPTSSFEERLSGVGSIRQLLALGRSLTCTFNYTPEDGGSVSGDVYIDGERMRGNFTMIQDGETMTSNVIRDGVTAYTWGTTPFGTMALKFPIEDEETGADDADRGVDIDENVDYDCRTWRVNASMFVPPSDIQFQDMGAEIQQIKQSETMLQDMQCSACDDIPDPNAQSQCRAALGCN